MHISQHETFEWDRAKNKRNIQKHGVSFELAAEILADTLGQVYHLESLDERYDHEDRWITLASLPADRVRVYYIVWTQRIDSITRIISARKATKKEVIRYEKCFK